MIPPPKNKYEQLIDKGKKLPPFPDEWKSPENLVAGCQSLMYLHATLDKGLVSYAAWSDALISKGLAAELIEEVGAKTPEQILTLEPLCLKELAWALSLGRRNGLDALWLKMKQQALAFLLPKA